MNFQQFKQNRYQSIPYDFPHNMFGFKQTNGSDISAHLPLLEFVARQCNTVTEFGTRECYSTVALLAGCKEKVTSYDINTYSDILELKHLDLPCEWEFIQQDTSEENFKINQTDFLFIDSLHTYNQVKSELRQAKYVNKYIGFHDVYSHGQKSLDIPGEMGIIPAINEFLRENQEWVIVYEVIFNHGLLIIERKTCQQ